MSDTLLLTEVFCAGCRKSVGLAASNVGRIFCNEFCANDWPVTKHESRDSIVAALVAMDKPKQEIAKAVGGMTHQRVGQIANERLR